MRLPLFEVEFRHDERIEELATSPENVVVDPLEFLDISPPENEFHTRLEVSVCNGEVYHSHVFITPCVLLVI